ncbi:MAG TPA: arginine N-succinyltransferase [Candidatus Binataceae bacterium]|nr:arginine N-succinyltransferase [Candidatus Binataceae bacterium]
MTQGRPAFLLRQAHPRDHRRLLHLARELDSINLPTDADELRTLLERSERSFHRKIRDRSAALYVFCAEEIATRRVVAASMIIAKHGTPGSAHYYLEIDSDERYSRTLKKMFRHEYLRLRHSMDGPTELGGLIVTRAMRGRPEHLGKQISWLRFLYIARHLHRFQRRVIAEILPPLNPDHGNPFWDHYGRPVTGLSFCEADRLSAHDKEFIQALFPDAPLYTFLLPEEVRASLGAIGEASRGAVRLLQQAGMKFLNQLDPFDGGPYYGAETGELKPVREYRRRHVTAGEPGDGARRYLIGCEDGRGLRAVATLARNDGKALIVAPGAIEALGVDPHALVDTVAIP